jgi:hypothetical protein
MPGVVVWCLYVVPTWGMLVAGNASGSEFYGVLSSTLAHMGGLLVGILVLRKVRMNQIAWFYAFIWYFIVQLASRFLTPVAFNVNLSQRIQDGWESMFTSYWKFWLVLSSAVALCLWLLTFVLKKQWPANAAS